MRLKFKNIKKANKSLTSVELNLYLYIAGRQDIKGLLTDLNITEASNTTGNSRQGLYDALYALEEKGFIYLDYSKNVNYDVIVIDNSFDSIDTTDSEEVEPYLNLNSDIFHQGLFYIQNIHIKRFILKYMSFNKRLAFSIDKLKSLNVFKYIDDLKHFFKIFTKSDGSMVIEKDYVLFDSDHPIQYEYVHHFVHHFIKKWKFPYDFDKIKGICKVISDNIDKPIRIKRSLLALKDADKGFNPKLFNAIFYENVVY